MSETFNIIGNPGTRLTFLGIAVSFMIFEYLLSRLARHDEETHDLAESAASFGVALGQNIVRGLEAGIVAIPFAFAYKHRLLDFSSTTPLAIGALFVATEFVYYWHHRASHRIRWMWATHAVHHSPTKLNFTAAIRLGWTGVISGNFLFFVPLAWIGFHPLRGRRHARRQSASTSSSSIPNSHHGSARWNGCSTRRPTIACITPRTGPASTRTMAAS